MRTPLLLCLFIATLGACGKQAEPKASPAESMANKLADADSLGVARSAALAPQAQPAAPPATPQQQLSSSANSYVDGERQFIRKAAVAFRVKDVYQSALAIEDIVSNVGGFVENNAIRADIERQQFQPIGDGKALQLSSYVVRGELTVRVPSAKTQAFLRQIAGQIAFLDGRTFTAHDAQFDLLRQKLKMKRYQENQQQLGQIVEEGGKILQKADVIAAQNDSKGIRDEAIVAEKEFADQVAFSRITFAIYQLAQVNQIEVTDIASIFEQSRPNFWHRLAGAMKSGWTWGLDSLIELMSIWPFWLLLLVSIVLGRKWRQLRQLRQLKNSQE